MGKFSETTGRATKKYLDATLETVVENTNTQVSTAVTNMNNVLNNKITEVNTAIEEIPDVNAVATQKAVAMAIVLG